MFRYFDFSKSFTQNRDFISFKILPANTTNSIANAQLDPNGTDTTPEDGLNDSVDADGNDEVDYTSTYAANALDVNVQGTNCPVDCTGDNIYTANRDKFWVAFTYCHDDCAHN